MATEIFIDADGYECEVVWPRPGAREDAMARWRDGGVRGGALLRDVTVPPPDPSRPPSTWTRRTRPAREALTSVVLGLVREAPAGLTLAQIRARMPAWVGPKTRQQVKAAVNGLLAQGRVQRAGWRLQAYGTARAQLASVYVAARDRGSEVA